MHADHEGPCINFVSVLLLAAASTPACQVLSDDISDGLLKKLQAVQNAAAHVVMGSGKFNHITPVLHWLPVRQRIKYTLAMIVYITNAYTDWGQHDWRNNCQAISAVAGKRHLRSAGTGTLHMPRITTTVGTRGFAVAGPPIWNSLPAVLWSVMLSPLTFAQRLKTHLFDWLTAHLRTIYDALYRVRHKKYPNTQTAISQRCVNVLIPNFPRLFSTNFFTIVVFVCFTCLISC